MEILAQVLNSFIFGIVAGAIPGPILTAALTEALRGGFAKSLRVVFKAVAGDTLVAIFILTAFFSLRIPQAFFYEISLAGAAVLAWLAFQVWKIKEVADKGEIFPFWKIFVLTVTNGPLWIFWITVCVPQAFLLSKLINGGQVLFLAVFEIALLLTTAAIVFVFSRFRDILIKKRLTPIIFKILSLVILFFAVKLLAESAIYLSGSH